jgi:hypothetical protein
MTGHAVSAELPSDVAIDRLVPALVTKMNMPKDAPYRMLHKESGQPLGPGETLAAAGVKDGDTLRLLIDVLAGCFTEDTLVTLADGSHMPIGEVKSGDEVMAYDEFQRSFQKSKVEGIYRQTYSELITINEATQMSVDQALLLCDGTWKRASDLSEGDVLLKYPFASLTVAKVARTTGLVSLCSLTLENLVCFVGADLVVKDLLGKQAYIPRVVDVFLSYSASDKDLAGDVFERLENAKKSVFLAEKSIKPGELWEDKIRDSLRNCKSFWFLVTPNSLKGEWVGSEWAAAWALGKPIVPILYRCKPEDLPRRIQDYQCVDFHELDTLLRP